MNLREGQHHLVRWIFIGSQEAIFGESRMALPCERLIMTNYLRSGLKSMMTLSDFKANARRYKLSFGGLGLFFAWILTAHASNISMIMLVK